MRSDDTSVIDSGIRGTAVFVTLRYAEQRNASAVRTGLVGRASLPVGVQSRQRCLSGRRMDGAVVDDLNPGRER